MGTHWEETESERGKRKRYPNIKLENKISFSAQFQFSEGKKKEIKLIRALSKQHAARVSATVIDDVKYFTIL